MGSGVTLDIANERPQGGPMTVAAVAWLAGLWLGWLCGGLWGWIVLACVALGGVVAAQRVYHVRWGSAAVAAAIVATAAGWYLVRMEYASRHDVARWIQPEAAQLAEVTGIVEGPTYLSSPQRGGLGGFAFADPTTIVVMDLRSILVDGQVQQAEGRLLVAIEEAEHRLRSGDRVRCLGWLAAIDGPSNPGEFDYRAMAKRQGIAGRLTLPSRGNWVLLDRPSPIDATYLHRARAAISEACSASLTLGMAKHHADGRLALLHALLLGQRQSLQREMTEAFRDVGLSHILSISGAHLGILVGLVWSLARLTFGVPSRSAMVALAVLLLYLTAVPMQTPIVRSAIMAAFYMIAYLTGWSFQGRRLDPLAAATLVVLVWRPGDLFDAGFQLSYGVVLAMMLFTPAVNAWLTPAMLDEVDPYQPGIVVVRWVIGYVAVSLVAFAAALPVVAYHFQIISPWAVVLSLVSLPVVTGVLAVGYLKIAAGLLLPSVGMVLAGPLAWLADTMAGLVEQARSWPGATVKLEAGPGVPWVLTTLGLTVALLAGRFRRRPLSLAAATAICVAWLVLPMSRGAAPLTQATTDRSAVTINMFAVGDGTCILVRWPGHTMMFDCGSQAYLDVGVKSIAPALQRLGVDRIDTLVLSHADMDHFCGVLDVVAAVPVGRVLVSPQMLRDAAEQPEGPTAYVLGQLRESGMEAEPISAGWQESSGSVDLAVLWPAADHRGPRRNDESLVLAIDLGEGRLLLTGDIAEEAMSRLMAGGVDLRADVAELPHHGSFVPDVSPAWLAAVNPSLVLQSSGISRMRQDRWGPHLATANVTRLATAEHGMIEVRLASDGSIAWAGFDGDTGVRGPAAATASSASDRR